MNSVRIEESGITGPFPVLMGGPSNEELMAKSEAIKAKLKKWDRAAFIHSLSPSPELWAIISDLTKKADVLKAVFEYNNRKPLALLSEAEVKRGIKRSISNYNAAVEAEYALKLQKFYDDCCTLHGDNEPLDDYIASYQPDRTPIKRRKKLSEEIARQPLFELDCILRNTRGRIPETKLKVTTRQDIYFTFEGKKINFGKFSFTINLTRRNVIFNPKPYNISQYAGPYISGSSVCLGDQSGSFSGKLLRGEVMEAMTELYSTMTIYNKESHPYRPLDRYFDFAQRGELKRIDYSIVQVERI